MKISRIFPSSLLALFLSWIGMIIFHLILTQVVFDPLVTGDVVFFIVSSAIISGLVFTFFFIPFESTILELKDRLSHTGFILRTMLYAVMGFTLLIGWIIILSGEWFLIGMVAYLDVTLAGLLFGILMLRLGNKDLQAKA